MVSINIGMIGMLRLMEIAFNGFKIIKIYKYQIIYIAINIKRFGS